MAGVSTNLCDQLLNNQVMELQDPDSIQKPEPARDSENNVADEDHRGGGAGDSNDGSEDQDDLVLAPMTPNQLICIMCGTRVGSTERLRRHTVKHHPEAAEMFEFLIETAVKIFPGIYAENQAQISYPTTSKVNSVSGKKYVFHSDHIQPDPETSTSARLREESYNNGSSDVSTKLLNEVIAPKTNQNSGNFPGLEKPFKYPYFAFRGFRYHEAQSAFLWPIDLTLQSRIKPA
ncbi:unnamed protein product [Orchesella dallaii]|uniref:C2H2-type domain-containing protein n=1 Tax=Orchesella dallaii TaxID=48710 RepID=A0ABP1PSZ2_9HEXA